MQIISQLKFNFFNFRQRDEKALKEKYPEEGGKSGTQVTVSMDYQSAIKRNKQLKQVINAMQRNYTALFMLSANYANLYYIRA